VIGRKKLHLREKSNKYKTRVSFICKTFGHMFLSDKCVASHARERVCRSSRKASVIFVRF
jgi:hypothetical protein